MLYAFSTICIVLMGLGIALNILSLPGNWVAVILLVLWAWLAPPTGISVLYLIVIIVLALAGEVLEFLLQLRGAKKYGSSSKGTFAGLVGAFIGALLGAPILFGLGALPGALLGAFVGCLIMELIGGRPIAEAKRAAWGALTGKFSGIILKITIGLTILVTGAQRVWP